MDMDLPGMDGWECTETTKENPETKHIPNYSYYSFCDYR